MLDNTSIKDYNDYSLRNLEILSDLSSVSMDSLFHHICKYSDKDINYYWLGRRDYHRTWNLQNQLQQGVKDDNLNNIVLFLEHDPIYTIGKNADNTNLLPTKPLNMEVVKTDRGGDITCHAPGQLVGYPIIDLKKYKKSITWFMRCLEQSIIDMLKEFRINSETKDGLTGVWVDDNKIAALGVRLSRWVSMHGFAINVYTDLRLFRGIIPCGITDYGLTSMLKLKDKKYNLLEIAELMTISLSRTFIDSDRIENVKA